MRGDALLLAAAAPLDGMRVKVVLCNLVLEFDHAAARYGHYFPSPGGIIVSTEKPSCNEEQKTQEQDNPTNK